MATWSIQPIIHQQTAKAITVPTIVYSFDTYAVPIISEHIEYIGPSVAVQTVLLNRATQWPLNLLLLICLSSELITQHVVVVVNLAKYRLIKSI